MIRRQLYEHILDRKLDSIPYTGNIIYCYSIK